MKRQPNSSLSRHTNFLKPFKAHPRKRESLAAAPGRNIIHTLFPVKDTQWSRHHHPTGKYFILTICPMDSGMLNRLVLTPHEVEKDLIAGGVLHPTRPRIIFDQITRALRLKPRS